MLNRIIVGLCRLSDHVFWSPMTLNQVFYLSAISAVTCTILNCRLDASFVRRDGSFI